MSGLERISSDDALLALLIRAELAPAETTFVTPEGLEQQVGFILHPKDQLIQRHSHRPPGRHVTGAGEVLVVRDGRCEVDLYDETDALVATRELRRGDVIVLVAGGHGFRMLEDTTFLEIKQGPYLGGVDKRYF